MALTDIAYKLLAFIVLTPLIGISFRLIVSLSGRTILADEDILFFILGPWGWLCLVTVGALSLGILALEQSALMHILCVKQAEHQFSLVGGLTFAISNAVRIVRVTARLVAWALLASAPFVAIAGLTYVQLLTQYDINYYLTQRPPEFLMALAIAGVIIVVWSAILLRLVTHWFFALPLVLFGNTAPKHALSVSREKASGHRILILKWIGIWIAVWLLLSALTTTLVIWIGNLLMPYAAGSIKLLMAVIGITIILGTVTSLTVNLLSTTTFAAILLSLYGSLVNAQVSDHLPTTDVKTNREGLPLIGNLQITAKRLVFLGVVGTLIAAGIGYSVMKSVRLGDQTEITAHRGASADAPENTMAAVNKAIEDGADWVEIDVQETADGEVVVFHDQDFMKLAGNDLKIWDATAKDLEQIDIGSWFGPEFHAERVPTLAAVLQACKGKARVNIELKSYGKNVKLEQRVAELVEAHEMESDIVIMSLKNDMVSKMKSLRPAWKVGLLTSVAIGDLTKENADFLAVNAGLATRDFIRSAHARQKEVHVWTVNDAVTMSTMIGRGADSLITDKPALARSVLDMRAQMSVPERLLLELATMLGSVPEIVQQ